MNIVVLGCQWGDEGKGKIIDFLASRVAAVVRFQGGNNAGHVIIVKGNTIKLHLIPSAIFHKSVKCIIANGAVVSLPAIFSEIETIKNLNINLTKRLYISLAAPLLIKSHILLDKAREFAKDDFAIGTTQCGIGPANEDRIARRGLHLYDLSDEKNLKEKLSYLLDYHNFILKNYYNVAVVDYQSQFDELLGYRDKINPMLIDTNQLIFDLHKENKNILFEGSQGTMLDIDLGTYPYTTSSNTTLGAVSVGSGCPTIDKVLGIIKSYTTRVGKGPFPTEESGKIGEYLCKEGVEYGTTTNRKRRCGWLDLVALHYAIKVNNIKSIGITKLDVLDKLDEIKVCTKYRYCDLILDRWPIEPQIQNEIRPIYEKFKGWLTSTKNIKEYHKLPHNAQKYLKFISDSLNVNIDFISTGRERDDLIEINEVF